MSMRKYANEQDAERYAAEAGRYLGHSVFAHGWFVGTKAELQNIGVVKPRKPSEIAVAAAKASAALKSKASGTTPSQSQYESREMMSATNQLLKLEKAPLADRKEAQAELLEAMQERPETVGERIEWLIDGNYGFGPMKKAEQVLDSPRMNQEAALLHLVAGFEWQTPGRMAIAAWKKLNASQKKKLSDAIKDAIKYYQEKER